MKVVLLLLALLCHFSYQAEETLKVSVYYECLCPDSIRFITTQLYPAYSKIGSSLLLDFVPYGKARHTLNNGQWKFRCQHGQDECQGNKYQACALAQNHTQTQNVEFVNCVMDAIDPSSKDTITKCALKVEFPADDITTCGESSKGDEILAELGDRTHAVQPKIYFIPTIIFNDVYDKDVHWGSISDFLGTACNALDNKPNGCK